MARKRRKLARARTGARGWKRLGALVGFALGAWCAGFVWFAAAIPRALPPDAGPADAAVVLTGGSGRIDEGVALLMSGRAGKLFVSGVGEGADMAAILPTGAVTPETVACCIVLGHDAADTRGNARETAAWMRQEGFTSLRLVTGAYHMPRSMVEFRSAMPDVAVVPHPVFPGEVRLAEWWRRPGTAALIAAEYTKYLFAVARSAFL